MFRTVDDLVNSVQITVVGIQRPDRVFTLWSKHHANVEQISSWLKQAYWNPACGSNVGLSLGS